MGPAVYLWAGQATVDLLRAKFPDRDVDVDAHLGAHRPEAARELNRRGFRTVFLSMNWGFPPEVERAHWEDFSRAAAVYRDEGLRILGYVQASNCVARGSYAERDWYAVTPGGRRVPYFRDRLMTCWNHPDWIREVERRAVRAVASGGHGVFLDNTWMGTTPWVLGHRAGGFAGCACERCAAAFRRAHGLEIPPSLREDERSERYLAWRAGVVRDRIAGWARAVRAKEPDATIVSNSCDAGLRDIRALFGIELADLAPVQDALLIENVAMPRREDERTLVANALPLKTVRSHVVDGTSIMSLTYERGIGLDDRPDDRRLRRTVLETLALGGTPVVKGSEYLGRDGRFTVITADEFTSSRRVLGRLFAWVEARSGLFRDTRPAARIGVLYDREAHRTRWGEVAPSTLALGIALLHESVAFRFVAAEELAAGDHGLDVLLAPRGAAVPEAARTLLVDPGAPEVPGAPARLTRSPAVRALADPLLRVLARAYFGHAPVRRAFDEAGLTERFLRSPFFRVPADSDRVRRKLPPAGVTVEQGTPVLVEPRERRDGREVLHLLNYEDAPVLVHVDLDARGIPELYTPDPGTGLVLSGDRVLVELDLYAALVRPPGTDAGGDPPARAEEQAP